MKKTGKNKVIVAMSGGVDSSVAAALLKRAGFLVSGVHLRLWKESSAEDRAKRVAQILGIPFYVFNLKSEFKKRVVDYFLKEYKAGRTPNPCVVCNKEMKFGLLLEKALALGADYVATGHYARLRRACSKCKVQSSKFELSRAKDKNKDQSYFLWQLNQKQLKHILLPVGEIESKQKVRELARRFGLPTARTKDSQEICFVEKTLGGFLKRRLKTKPGPIVDENGKKLGGHKGLWFYTIGQRKGIEVAGIAPYYVLDKDVKRNVLIVTDERKELDKKELTAKDVNWISGQGPKLPLKAKAQIRYYSPAATARLERVKREKGGEYKVIFSKPQRAITPGQSVVFYKGQELLGGGVIA